MPMASTDTGAKASTVCPIFRQRYPTARAKSTEKNNPQNTTYELISSYV